MSRSMQIAVATAAILVCSLVAVQCAFASPASPLDNPKTNVFFRYGINPVSGDDYSSSTESYDGRQFIGPSFAYGYLAPLGNLLNTHAISPNETITGTQVTYELANGKQVFTRWNGRHPLHISRRIGHQQASLIVAVVGLNNTKLPEQHR